MQPNYAETARPGVSAGISTALIRAYQRYLSPIKGYQCAYSHLHGGPSCSAVGLEAFATNNFGNSVLILQSRFKDCQESARELRAISPMRAVGVGCCGTGCSC